MKRLSIPGYVAAVVVLFAFMALICLMTGCGNGLSEETATGKVVFAGSVLADGRSMRGMVIVEVEGMAEPTAFVGKADAKVGDTVTVHYMGTGMVYDVASFQVENPGK